MEMRAEKKRNTVLNGAISLTLSVIIVKVLGFLFKMPLSRILGDTGMGYFNSAYTVFTFFYMLCTGGVPRAVSILVSEAEAKGESKESEYILRYAISFFLIIGITFSAILLFLSDSFAKRIGNDLAAFSLRCIAPSLSFVAASGVVRGYLIGRERMLPVALSEIIEGTVKFVLGLSLALCAARRGSSVEIVSAYAVLGVSLGSFVGAAFLYISAKILKTDEKAGQKSSPKSGAFQVFAKILHISVPLALSSAVMGITNIIDLGVITNQLLSYGATKEEAIALFGNFTTLAVPMLNLVMALLSPATTASLPKLASMSALGHREDFDKFIKQILSVISLVSAPIACAFLFFPGEILSVLFEDASALRAAPLAAILSPSMIFLPLLTVSNTAHEASGHQEISLLSMLAGAAAKFASGCILIPRIGIGGAPISTGICYGVAWLLSFSLMLRLVDMSLNDIISVFLPYPIAFIMFYGSRMIYQNCPISTGSYLPWLILSLIPVGLGYLIFGAVFLHKRSVPVSEIVSFAKK